MTARYDQEVEAVHPLSQGLPRMVESEIERNFVQFTSHSKPKGIQLPLKMSSIM
jgi:hypothetical protein